MGDFGDFSIIKAFYIGLPKAAINNQARAIGQCTGMMALGHRHDDIMYAVTPLYHGTAMVVGLFNTIGRGQDFLLITQKTPCDCHGYI